MNDTTATCLFCGAKENLNCKMSVTINEQKWTVAICEKDEELASPSSVKTHLMTRLKEIEELKERASKLGLTIVTEVPAIQSDLSAEPPAVVPVPRQALQPQVIRGQPVRPPHKSPTQTSNADKNSSGNKTDESDNAKLRKIRQDVEMQPVETVGGGIRGYIPKRAVGDAGTSDITIIHSSDADIKKSMSMLNDDRRLSSKVSNLLRECTMCGSSGKNRILGGPCPKCKGRGYII